MTWNGELVGPEAEAEIERRKERNRFNRKQYDIRQRSLQANNRLFLKKLAEEQRDQDEERRGDYR